MWIYGPVHKMRNFFLVYNDRSDNNSRYILGCEADCRCLIKELERLEDLEAFSPIIKKLLSYDYVDEDYTQGEASIAARLLNNLIAETADARFELTKDRF